MRTSMPRALYSSGLPWVPGTRIMSPKAVKITFGSCGDGEAVVDSAHGQHADRAAGTMNQFDVRRQQILQAEAIDGVGVAAAHFHEAVVALGIGQAADLLGGFRDHAGFAEFVDKFHVRLCRSRPYPCTSSMAASLFAEHGQHAHLIERSVFADLAHGEADVDQHPVAGFGGIVRSSPISICAPHADHFDQGAISFFREQLNDFCRNCEAHMYLNYFLLSSRDDVERAFQLVLHFERSAGHEPA